LLDLGATFNTLDHSILLEEPRINIWCSGMVYMFTSYVSDHYQSVVVDGISSLPSALLCGELPGYVLGPGLFTLYTQPLYLFHLSLTGDNISLNNQ